VVRASVKACMESSDWLPPTMKPELLRNVLSSIIVDAFTPLPISGKR
jgi:hypothetical protein